MKKIKIIVSIIVLVSVCTIGFLYLNNRNQDISGTSISGYVLGKGIAPDLTPEQIQELLQKEVDASKIAFSINSEPKFNGKIGTIMFANPRYSAHNIDLEVKVDNKVIIRTEKISPDQYIEKIELMGKKLKKGQHNGVATIIGYDRKTDEEVGRINVDMTITSK